MTIVVANSAPAIRGEIFRQMIRNGEPSQTDVVRGAIANLVAWRAIESWDKGVAVEMDYSYLRTL